MDRRQNGQSFVTGSFRDRDSAQRAYDSLTRRGYTADDIHVIMSDETHKRHFPKDMKTGNKAMEGAGVGGVMGGAVGAGLVAAAAAASSIAVPGIGLVIAGPLAGALAGGAVGGAAGTLVGGLVGAGIPEEQAKLYERDVRGGNIVLGVSPRDDRHAEELEREWSSTGEHVYR